MLHRLHTTVFIIAVLSLVISQNALCATDNVKYGPLTHDETWHDEVYLVGDVVIPKGITLTIEAGTRLYFADYDIFASGEDKTHSEIIVYGTLDAQSLPDNPIYLDTINGDKAKPLNIDKNTAVINFNPYHIETEPLREEFRSFKRQYLVLWSIIYAMWILAI